MASGQTAPDAKSRAADAALQAAATAYFPSDTATVSAKRIFRLTREQIDSTVSSLLPGYFTQSVKAVMAKDPLQTNYEYAEILSFNAANFGSLAKWIGDIASRVRTKPGGVIDCAGEKPTDDCLKSASRDFVIRAFRGDVTETRIERISAFYRSGVQSVGFAQATGDLVEVVLNSPDFLFRKEIDVSATGRLSPAQLLEAVTYTTTDQPPEALKLQSHKAADYLRTGKDAGSTIQSIVASPQAREKLVRFFKAWLEIKEPGEFTISQQAFPEFDAKLATAMTDETNRFLRTQLGKPSPRLTDITQAPQSFASKALEPIYGTRSADAAAGATTTLDPSQRLGIFSQPAVLASHSGPTSTQPIKRGVFWVRKVMCMEMESPPKEISAAAYASTQPTERKRVEQLTGQSACIGCHKVINPFGFFQEGYDALGRWRTTENGHPIDTSVLIDFLDEEPTKAAGPVEALKTLTNSLMFKQCFVRQMFRYYMGRREEPSDDSLLRRMFVTFAKDDTQDILGMVYLLSSSDRIVKRQ
jgi:Protein of unknown function (DUF1588)/Protein of unknown function (DUF1592)/Protein of unknown function (DUF1595)/Protein of unknown function (DUF1585)